MIFVFLEEKYIFQCSRVLVLVSGMGHEQTVVLYLSVNTVFQK